MLGVISLDGWSLLRRWASAKWHRSDDCKQRMHPQVASRPRFLNLFRIR